MKTKNSLIRSLAIIGILYAATTQIHAQGTLYVSNLGETSYNGGPFNDGENSLFGLSAGFVTGTNAIGYTLNSVRFLMGDSGLGPGGFYVSIFSDNGGQPGTSLEALSGSPSPYVAGTYTYTSSGITLSPSTTYWIVMSSDSPYLWEDTISANYDSSDGWSLIQPASGQLLQFGINASITPVPEPGSLAFIGLGLTAILLRHKKFRVLEMSAR